MLSKDLKKKKTLFFNHYLLSLKNLTLKFNLTNLQKKKIFFFDDSYSTVGEKKFVLQLVMFAIIDQNHFNCPKNFQIIIAQQNIKRFGEKSNAKQEEMLINCW